MEKIIVTLKGQKNAYFATGIFEDGKITIQKGSRISMIFAKHIKGGNTALAIRKDNAIVDEKGNVLKDYQFSSPSTAAQFVTGRSSNGYICWRPDNKMSLKKYLEKNKIL